MLDKFLDINDIIAARKKISGYIRHTQLLYEPKMKEIPGQVYLKPECLQFTGAFKLRGALNAILSMPEDERKKGIITSSSGNHAQACAYAGEMLGVPAVVVIPEDAPEIKANNAKAMGAEVIRWKRDYASRWVKVHEEVEKHGYNIVHPYEDRLVMAGQGTMALEIMDDLSDVDTVVFPIGGGGLASGVSTAIKETNPNIRTIGVQAINSAAYLKSREAGHPVEVECFPTYADGLSCRKPGNNPYPIIDKYVDEIVGVKEEEILEGVKYLAEKAHIIAEPSSAVVISAALYKKFKIRENEKTVFIITSGNWDLEKFGHVFLGESVQGVL